MCFTPEAILAIRESVGYHPPETGAKGFGPVDRMGVDVVEFDERADGRSHAVYVPDTDWADARIRHWIERDPAQMRLWTMDVHSHPGGMGMPSRKVQPSRHDPDYAMGDLGYVEAVFAQNELMQYFYLPILTGTGRSTRYVELHPWIVSRDDPLRPMLAEVLVDRVENFPERIFNPAWAGADRPSAKATEGVAP